MRDVVKVAIGIPSMNQWIGDFGMSLVGVVSYSARVPFVDGKTNALHLVHTKSSVLAKSRWDIVKLSRAWGAEWLLFVDTDQMFPEDTIHRLLSWKKPLVGANIAVKKLPSNPTARAWPKKGELFGEPVYTDPKSSGIEKVWRVGCGVLLVKMEILDGLKPGEMFSTFYREDIDDFQGEDWTLIEALERKGISPYIDHNLSKSVAHVGYLEYTHELVGSIERVPRKGGQSWLQKVLG